MHHPTSRAERRRINKKKKYDYDREFAVQQQLEQEAKEQREIIEQLRKGVDDIEGTLD